MKIVQYLVDHGLNVNAKDRFGGLPIHIASEFGKLGVIKYFVEKCGVNINAKNNDGVSCIHLASDEDWLRAVEQSAKLEVIQYLVENGADINAQTNDGKTALLNAMVNNYKKIIRYLIEKGADFIRCDRNRNMAVDLVRRMIKEKIVNMEDVEEKDVITDDYFLS